jgi:phosphopantothenoylcysteine decarboxylase/phosphopantothenate--cysteine ligase
MLGDRNILLIIGAGIAAYKSLELIRRLRDGGATVRSVMTAGATHFVTPLSVAALTEHKVYQDLFSLTDESEMGHIRLSRESDLIVVAPATADMMARMAAGMADDLATAVLLATDKPVLIAPTMNLMMWSHAATQANVALLRQRGITTVGPGSGDLACGEVGSGRMAEPHEIIQAIDYVLSPRPLDGASALVTSGPTYEPIDPVRFIGNRSSGKQGHAIAAALARAGARTTLISGPTNEPDPAGVALIRIQTASEMLAAAERLLPVDIAVCAAAVADWRVATQANEKLKKLAGGPPTLSLVENPDILARIGQAGAKRPRLVVGFAAETENLVANARAKLAKKGCDWVLANDVSPSQGTFGGERNTIHLVSAAGVEDWPTLSKREVADRLAARVAMHLSGAS